MWQNSRKAPLRSGTVTAAPPSLEIVPPEVAFVVEIEVTVVVVRVGVAKFNVVK
jgi:hypothetical protein